MSIRRIRYFSERAGLGRVWQLRVGELAVDGAVCGADPDSRRRRAGAAAAPAGQLPTVPDLPCDPDPDDCWPRGRVGDIFLPLSLVLCAHLGLLLEPERGFLCDPAGRLCVRPAAGDHGRWVVAEMRRSGLGRAADMVGGCGYLVARATSALDRPGADPHNPCPHSSPGSPSVPPR